MLHPDIDSDQEPFLGFEEEEMYKGDDGDDEISQFLKSHPKYIDENVEFEGKVGFYSYPGYILLLV